MSFPVMPSTSWTEKLKFWKIFWISFPGCDNKGFAFLNGINTSSHRRSKDTFKVITTDIFRFPGNPSHECTRSKRAVCEKLQSFQILKLQVDQRENNEQTFSQITKYSTFNFNSQQEKVFHNHHCKFFQQNGLRGPWSESGPKWTVQGVKVDGS